MIWRGLVGSLPLSLGLHVGLAPHPPHRFLGVTRLGLWTIWAARRTRRLRSRRSAFRCFAHSPVTVSSRAIDGVGDLDIVLNATRSSRDGSLLMCRASWGRTVHKATTLGPDRTN